MGKIIYHTSSFFDAPKDVFLVHSCNAEGVWGSGIAKQFKNLHPKSFLQYKNYCDRNDKIIWPWNCLITTENVVCFFTSVSYGNNVDSPQTILRNTENALRNFLPIAKAIDRPIHSNKFNSGLFGVEWSSTETLIREGIEVYDLEWNVWQHI